MTGVASIRAAAVALTTDLIASVVLEVAQGFELEVTVVVAVAGRLIMGSKAAAEVLTATAAGAAAATEVFVVD